MSEATKTEQKAEADEVRALLRELSQQLLAWSWEGVVGYEEMVERSRPHLRLRGHDGRYGSPARDD